MHPRSFVRRRAVYICILCVRSVYLQEGDVIELCQVSDIRAGGIPIVSVARFFVACLNVCSFVRLWVVCRLVCVRKRHFCAGTSVCVSMWWQFTPAVKRLTYKRNQITAK